MRLDEQVSLTQEQFIGILGNVAALELMVVALASGYPDKLLLWKNVNAALETKLGAMSKPTSAPEMAAQDLMVSQMRCRLQMLLDAGGCG